MIFYANWIFANIPLSENKRDPLDEPAIKKVLAATWQMLEHPDFFNPELTGIYPLHLKMRIPANAIFENYRLYDRVKSFSSFQCS